MPSLRAPLFSVSLAFAIGCVIGLNGWLHVRAALGLFVLAGVLWFLLKRSERAALAAFFGLTVCGGIVHTLLSLTTIAPDDLRRLPVEKSDATTQWRGTIVEEPVAQLSTRITRRPSERTTFVLEVEAWRPTGGRLFGAGIDLPWQSAQGRVRCTMTGPAQELQCGDRIEFAAPLLPVAPPLCPGELDDPAWEALQGISYHATIPALAWQRTQAGGGHWWQNLSYRARDWTYGRLQLGLEDDPRMADFLAGMLIGYRQQIPADIEQDFRRTGTLHVFAVSGQNIAEMVVVAMILLQLCGLVRWRWAWMLAPMVLLYCLLTGSPASAIRATVMALAVLLAWRLGRPLNALGCWSLAFLAMLIWNPAMLRDPGAQLSFGVVLGIILLSPPLMRILARPFTADPFLPRDLLSPAQTREERCWRWLAALVAATIAATVVSEPITAVDFHQVTPISVFANLIVVPVAGLITVVGTMSVAVSLVSTTLAALLNNANWLFAKGLILFVGFLAHEPGAAINVPDVRALASPAPSFLVAPVQDSACLLVRTGGGNWLINTGREMPARSVTERLLQFYGINRLDGLVLAQISVADNSGAAILDGDFHPRRIVVPLLPSRSPFEKTISALGRQTAGRIETWQRGHAFSLAPDLSVEILHPAADDGENHAADRALVLLFHHAGGTLLWAGKIGPETESELLAASPELHADVLVMGTEPPPGREWLQALGVREWLQVPPRDRLVNSTAPPDVPGSCQVWPLDQTGAVEVRFMAAKDGYPAAMSLRPWVALPK